MAQFIWVSGESVTFLQAKDREEAIRKVIECRKGDGSPEEAIRGFKKHDDLIEVNADLEPNAPLYTGDVSDLL